jgi:hypothetical protein
MITKRTVGGSVVTFVGFMLSPLSWWNDLFVNLPLALAFAWVIALFYKPAFAPSVVLGYWLTNIAGFILMHKGAQLCISAKSLAYTRRDLLRDLAISLLYTALIVALIQLGALKPIASYLP